jgi:hypothetical protein
MVADSGRIVFFFGAGASAEFGIPPMRKMAEDFKSMVNNRGLEIYNEIVEMLKEVKEADKKRYIRTIIMDIYENIYERFKPVMHPHDVLLGFKYAMSLIEKKCQAAGEEQAAGAEEDVLLGFKYAMSLIEKKCQAAAEEQAAGAEEEFQAEDSNGGKLDITNITNVIKPPTSSENLMWFRTPSPQYLMANVHVVEKVR